MNSSTDPAVLFGVEGLVAVVTGGGTGIGLMIATALENNGATVYVIGRRLDVLERAAAEHNKFGNMIPLQGDVTSRESLLAVVQTIKARHGYIDLLVNNAGIARNLLPPHLPSPLDDIDATSGTIPSIKSFQDVLWNTGDPSGFTETFETNLTAVYYTTVAFLELLHLGNIRRGSLPPILATRSISIGRSKGRRATNMEVDEVSTQDSASSTPPGAYYSIPPTPPASNSPLPPDVCLPTASPTNALSGIPLPTSQVITISSSGAFRVDARILSVSYTLAKHATTHLGKLLANLLADWNIRSNILCPGVWPSEMTSLKHLTPALLAQTVPLGHPGTAEDDDELDPPLIAPDLPSLRAPHPTLAPLPGLFTPALPCRGRRHANASLSGLNIPLFIATDASDPASDPLLVPFLNTFPCTFFLSDFDEQMRQPRLDRLVNAYDGIPMKQFMLPFLDAMVVGRARDIATTDGSTFSAFIGDVLWRRYHGWEIVQRG